MGIKYTQPRNYPYKSTLHKIKYNSAWARWRLTAGSKEVVEYQLVFHAAWADAAGVNQPLLVGTSPVTTTHAEAILALGSDGDYDTYAVDAPVWRYDADGDYLVSQHEGTNSQIQSNDQTNVEYTPTNVTVAQDEAGLQGSANTACTLTATAANGTVIANAIVAASGEHAAKWYIKRKTGTGDIDLTLDNGTGWTTVTLTSDFDLFAIDQAALTNPQIGIRIVTSGDAVIVGNAECHLTSTVEEVKSIGPIFTTSAAATTSAFDNEYPAANHSNTEGPYYLEFENTGDDVVLMSAGTDEFLRIEDGGSVDIWTDSGTSISNSGGSVGAYSSPVMSNTAIGTNTSYPRFYFTIGTITVGNVYSVYGRLSGDIDDVGQIRLATVGSSANINYDSATGIISGVVTAEATRMEIHTDGTLLTSITIEEMTLREVDGKYLKLTDGTNQIQAACAAGEHKAGVAFDADTSLMNLNLDGTWADLTDSTAYDGTLGSGVLTLGETERNVKRWNETDLTKQKDIIDEEMA